MNESLDDTVRASSPAEGGLLARARRFSGALLEHVATRGELLAVEIGEEKERLIHALIAAGLLLLCAGMVLVFAGVLALVLAWDSEYRNVVAWLIPVAFLAIGIGSWLWLKSLIGRKTALFRDSLRDLRQDAQALRQLTWQPPSSHARSRFSSAVRASRGSSSSSASSSLRPGMRSSDRPTCRSGGSAASRGAFARCCRSARWAVPCGFCAGTALRASCVPPCSGSRYGSTSADSPISDWRTEEERHERATASAIAASAKAGAQPPRPQGSTPFISDVRTLRERARRHIEEGAVTEGYGANRDVVLKLLNEALATELVCVLRYKRHYYMAEGPQSDAAAAEFLEHAQQEQEHADQIAARIVQLGGEPDFAPDTLTARSHAEYVPGKDLVDMIKEDLVAERIAIDSYREMVAFIGEGDSTTRRMLEDILAVEEEHADDLASLLAADTSLARAARG